MEEMINLQSFANGAFAERVNQGLKQVLDNIADPNTEWKSKRKLTISLTFDSSEDRELTEVDIAVIPKLAPKSIVRTKMVIGRDLNGIVLGTEFKRQVPGQTTMKVDNETGEYIHEKEVSGLQIVK
jgi:hypothetical protein